MGINDDHYSCETKYCNVYDTVCHTCYECDSGYTKINDNYCYKIN